MADATGEILAISHRWAGGTLGRPKRQARPSARGTQRRGPSVTAWSECRLATGLLEGVLASQMAYFVVVTGSSSIVVVMNLLVQTHTHIPHTATIRYSLYHI